VDQPAQDIPPSHLLGRGERHALPSSRIWHPQVKSSVPERFKIPDQLTAGTGGMRSPDRKEMHAVLAPLSDSEPH
jgi:hypothetical protein